MTQTEAQVLLTSILLVGAIVFVLLGTHQLAVALVGAIAGQGAAVSVSRAANGNGGKG
jgi:hypothetical protein